MTTTEGAAMDYMLDDVEGEYWAKQADEVRAILSGKLYRDTVDGILEGFQDVNQLLEEYGFEPVHTLAELRAWI